MEPPAPLPECEDFTITADPEVTVTQTEFLFDPACLVVLGGQSLVLRNDGTARHNFSVKGTGVDLDTAPGEETRTEPLGSVLDSGTHGFFCKYHRTQGMVGEITVSGAG